MLFDWLMNRLPSRKIDWEPVGPRPPIPDRGSILVVAEIKKIDSLAYVKRNWLGNKLFLRFSKYISDNYSSPLKIAQATQVCLHELMHVALWDDLSIEHSQDPFSILYSIVDGSNLSPTAWDLEVMRNAATRINMIEVDTSKIEYLPILTQLRFAMKQWNTWIGRKLFYEVKL